MASLTSIISHDVLRHIFEYLIDNNTSDSISYALVSKDICNIVSIVIRSQILVSKMNPYLKDLYGHLIHEMKNHFLAACIKYSYDLDENYGRYGVELIEILQKALFSKSVTADLRQKSEEILGRFIDDKKFTAAFDKMTGIISRNVLFPIVYEFSTSRLDNMDALMLSSKYFNHPPKIVKHLLRTVPQDMKQYLIPYDEKEKNRLVEIAKWGERLRNILIYMAINFALSLFYGGYLSVHTFNIYAFFAIYLGVNNFLYALVKRWDEYLDVTVYFPAANGAIDDDNEDEDVVENDGAGVEDDES